MHRSDPTNALRRLRLLLLLAALAVLPAGSALAAACDDGLDNDGDFFTDYPNDPDCADPTQDDEVGPEPPYTAHFAAEPTGSAPELVLPTLRVTALGEAVRVTNAPDEQGGLGVDGFGAEADFVDVGETLVFFFEEGGLPRTARDVAYRVHAGPGPVGSFPGEVQIDLFDHDGNPTGSSLVNQGLGTRDVSLLFGTNQIAAFAIRPLQHPIRISGLLFTINAACEDGLDNDGDFFSDYPNDADCADPTQDDEVGPEPPYTVHFAAEPAGTSPQLVFPTLRVMALGEQVRVTNASDEQGGLGVDGFGAEPDFVDVGETLVFLFEEGGLPRTARDVAYRVHAAPGGVGPFPGEVQIDLFDHDGNPTGPTLVNQGLGTRDVSLLFGTSQIAAFAIRPLQHPIRISGLVYTINAACEDGLDNDGDFFSDYPNDADCADPTQDDEVGPEPPYTAHFAAEATGSSPEVVFPNLRVMALGEQVRITNASDEQGGLGVDGFGAEPDFVDVGETLVFLFEQDGLPRTARDVAYRLHAAPGAVGNFPGEVQIDLFDHDGNPMGPTLVNQGLGTRDVSLLFGTSQIAAFAIRPLQHPIRISGLLFTINASCEDGLDNDGDFFSDYPNDADCADPTQDDEVGPEPPYTVHFAAEPAGSSPQLVFPTLRVMALGEQVRVTNASDEQGGLGVDGFGAEPDFVDVGETLVFLFEEGGLPRTARDVAYRVHAAPGGVGPFPGEVQIDLFDHDGNPTGPTLVNQGLGTRDVSLLFGTSQIAAFAIRPLQHPIRISGLVYTINAACEDGLDNDGDFFSDYPNDADCADPTQDDEVGPEPPYTANFRVLPNGQLPELVIGGLRVGALGETLSLNESLADEFGGLGVAGFGPDDGFVDVGETLVFTFGSGQPRNARDVAYRLHAAPGAVGPFPGEVQIDLLDRAGNPLGPTLVTQGLGTRPVSDLFGDSRIEAFALRPLQHPIRVSGLVYTLNPTCSDGLDNDGDGFVDFDGGGVGQADPQCAGNPAAAENAPGCGLGFEAVPFLVLWRSLRRRRRS